MLLTLGSVLASGVVSFAPVATSVENIKLNNEDVDKTLDLDSSYNINESFSGDEKFTKETKKTDSLVSTKNEDSLSRERRGPKWDWVKAHWFELSTIALGLLNIVL